MTKKINSCQKGKRGELAICRLIMTVWRTFARRGQQFKGTADSPDVVLEELPDVHVEVKFVERLNVHAAYDKAVREADGKLAILFWKRTRDRTLLVVEVNEESHRQMRQLYAKLEEIECNCEHRSFSFEKSKVLRDKGSGQ